MRIARQFGMWVLFLHFAGSAIAVTALKPAPEVNVSQTAEPTEKAKAVRLTYQHGSAIRRAWLYTYGDGPPGRQDVYARFLFDDIPGWSAPILLSRDSAGSPTGGQEVVSRTGRAFIADNDKPVIYAPPLTSGPGVVVAWNSGYCPPDPGAPANAGRYVSASQGESDYDGDGTPDRPFHCIWIATTADPTLATWEVSQLTNGLRDAVNEVIAGSSSGKAFALAWQEDPAGLQPGEAEGMGDGGSGSNVSPGTNIWYTSAPAPSGAALRANIVQLSDNDLQARGSPGASRPNLHLSGSFAALAYEEKACPGGSGGKCIVYHAFPYANPDVQSAGTIVSDVTKNSRRVRFVMQGDSMAGSSSVRTFLLWRQSSTLEPAAPADIMVRRGLMDTAARPGSNGFLPADVLADTPQNMTNAATMGGNAMAHRAVLRGSFVGVAYILTLDMDGANPEKTAPPSANYNLYFTRSTAEGRAQSWSSPTNLSQLDDVAYTVVEPRLVPTPGTIVNPLTGLPEDGDTQDTDVLFAAYATQRNSVDGAAGRVYLSRSTDQGASFEPFVPVSSAPAGQSESQIQPRPDGGSATVLWMGESTPGNPATKEAMGTVVTAIPLPDLSVTSGDVSVTAGDQFTLTLRVHNRGEGDARGVIVSGALPRELAPVGIGNPGECTISLSSFRCTFAQIPSNGDRVVSITVAVADEGDSVVTTAVSSEDLDENAADNGTTAKILASAATPPPPTTPPPIAVGSGGGCTLSGTGAGVDPSLPLLLAFGALGWALRWASPARSANPQARLQPAS